MSNLSERVRALPYGPTSWALTQYIRSLSNALTDESAPDVESWKTALVCAVAYGAPQDLALLFDEFSGERLGDNVRAQTEHFVDRGAPLDVLAKRALTRLRDAQSIATASQQAVSEGFVRYVQRLVAELPARPNPPAEEPLTTLAAFIATGGDAELHAYFDDQPLRMKLQEHLGAWHPRRRIDRENAREALRRLQQRPVDRHRASAMPLHTSPAA